MYIGALDNTNITGHSLRALFINESDLALNAAVPGQSQGGKQKTKAVGEGGLTLQGCWPGIEVVRWGVLISRKGQEIS